MQKQSEDNTSETSEDVTSQNSQYHHYPPCVPTIDQQFANRYTIPQNNGLVQSNIYSAGILNPNIAAARQHYALYQQQMQQPRQQQQPPQQQMYYQPYPQQQQQNPTLGDLNAALHLTSTLINQFTANNNNNSAPFVHAPNLVHAPRMAQPPATVQNQNTTVDLTNGQPQQKRMINYDHVEIPNNNTNGSFSQLQHQKARPAKNGLTDRSREETSLIGDCKEDTSQRGQKEEEAVVGAAAQQEIVKRRRSNANAKRQKKSSIRNGGHVQAVPLFKRKEPPELQHSELKMDSKPAKRQRESDVKQVRALPIHQIDSGFGKKKEPTKPTPETKTKLDREDPAQETKTEPDCIDPIDKILNVSMVVPEDEHLVSPYIITVMRQYKRCSLEKKEGRQHALDLGFPGLECIHCTTHQYFHSNSRSISSNITKIGDHLLKCSGAPDALKNSIIELKDEHKTFKCQGRQAFFEGIFDRLLRDYKKNKICTDDMKKHLPENENKTSARRGNTNGKKEAKSASSLAAQKASVDVCRGNTNGKKEEAKKPASSLPAQKTIVDVRRGNTNGKKEEAKKPANSIAAQKTSVDSNEIPLVHAGDEQLANAFSFFVASQYKRCVVDGSQRSRFHIGFPGLECIHCTGFRQFNSDQKNLRKNFSHLSNHLTECKGAPDTVKETVSKLPRRSAKFPNPDSFFNNIWTRLHGDSFDKEQGASVKKQKINAPATPKSKSDTFAAVQLDQKATVHQSTTLLVLAEDKQLTNDFIFTLMSQFRGCKLDLFAAGHRKGLKFDPGHPGLECIHCVGPNSKKFFYGTSNIFINNYHQQYKHLLECESAPATLKESLKTLKDEHGKTSHKDREAFFNAIWARLQHEYDAGPEEKKRPMKTKANENTGKKQKSKSASDVSDRRPCHECRKKKQKCDGKRRYCLYNVGTMITDRVADRHDTASTRQPIKKKSEEVPLSNTAAAEDSFLCKVISKDSTQISYPHAPMGQLWLDKSFAASRPQSDLSDEASIDLHAGGTLIGRRYVWDEGYFVDQHHDVENMPSKKNHPILRGCTCGADHSYTMGGSMESDNEGMKSRRSERSGGSIRTSTVLSKLADGSLSPHTLIYPEEYTMGPELRFNKNLLAENVQPFSIRVSPDALFLADLHAHLSDSEIIGFLGGHYSSSEKCIYIQAAFPCKATDRFDAGDTDVEMDPVSQIYAREAISNHGLSVVGWYHSHPTFQPNPSVTDIENQASYQQLFQGDNDTPDGDDSSASPFVGLIIGTYDGQNPTSESVMRWFHVISKKAEGKDVNYPMQLKTTNRHFRVLDDELRPAMTSQGASIRQGLESKYLSCPITKRSQPSHVEPSELDDNTLSAASSTKMAEQQTQKKRPDDCQDEHVKSSSRSTGKEKDYNVAIIENDRPALLLSEPLFEQPRQGNEAISWKFKSAIPLYFTATEKKILHMDTDTVPNDVLAGIIWFAVEREQANPATKSESLLPALASPSSRAILELLLRLSFTGTDDMQRKLYEVIHSLESLEDSESTHDSSSDEMRFDDIDAVISHKVDAVLSHYCSSTQKKINPFKSWSGAGDKGKNIATEMDETRNSASTSTIAVDNSWAHYYLTEVLRMGCDQVGDRKVYRGGSKMKRGQKIASCLLRWARRMQLRPDFEAVMSHKSCNKGDLKFDSETSQQVAPIKNGYIFVVAEVMRLLAARWSETSGNPSRQRSRRG